MKIRTFFGKKSGAFLAGLFIIFLVALTFGILRSGASEQSISPKVAGKKERAQKAKTAAKSPSGNVTSGISITPASVDFGTVTVGTHHKTSLTIRNAGAADLVVSGIDFSGMDLSQFQFSNGTCTNFNPAIKPRESCTIMVTYSPSSPGPMKTKFVVSSNAPSSPKIDVFLTATAVAAPKAQKSEAAATATPSAKPAGPAGRTPAPQQKAVPAGGQPAPAAQKPAPPLPAVVPHGAPTAATTPAIVKSSGISVTPASFDFGTVTVGTPKNVSVTIHNTGAADLVVSGIDFSGMDLSQFQFSNGTCPSFSPTINPGKSCAIMVTFAPSSPGPMKTKFAISSNAPSSPKINVFLTATAVAAPHLQPESAAAKEGSQQKKAVPAEVQPSPRTREAASAGAMPQGSEHISVELNADKKSPVIAATVGSVLFTAHTVGGDGRYEYKFWLKGPSTGNTWRVAQDYSASAAYPWIPTMTGSYVIWVYSRDVSNPAASVASAWMPFDVLQNPPVSSITITTDKTSPALRRTMGKVTFTPHAVGGSGTDEYKFWLKGPSTGNTWRVAQDYGISNSFTWAPTQAGHYLLWVYARSAGSNAVREAAAWTSFDVIDNPPVESVKLAADRTSPVTASAGAITFTADASGGSGIYEYEFWLKGPSTGDIWKVVRDYGASDTFSWTPAEAGGYLIAVYARNAGSPASHEAIAGMACDIADK